MDINRFTEKAQEALAAAQRLATRLGQQQVDVEHLLLALLDQEQGLAPAILSKSDISVDALKVRVQRELERCRGSAGRPGGPEQVHISSRLNRLLTQAEDEAKQLKDDYVSVEHLLLAMTDDTGTAGRILQGIRRHARPAHAALQEVRGHQRVTSPEPGRHLPGPGALRPRPDPAGPARQARSRSSAAMRRFAASSRCCRGAPRTTRC